MRLCRHAFWVVVAGIMVLGQPIRAAELREGERLDGYTFHTYVDIPFESRQRAEQWLQMNADLEEAKLLEQDGQLIVRVPRVYENLLHMVGQSKVSGSERFENGVFSYQLAETYNSEEEAKQSQASDIYRGGENRKVIDLGVEKHPEHKEMFRRRVEVRRDLVDTAQRKNLWHAKWLKAVVRNPGGGIEPLDPFTFTGGHIGMRGRPIFDRYFDTYLANFKKDRMSATVGRVAHPGAARHILLEYVAYRPNVFVRQFGDHHVLVAEGEHLLTGKTPTVVVWQSGPKTVLQLGAVSGVDIEPLVRAYLAWHPSTWPTEDYEFDRMAWLKQDVEIALERLSWHLSDEARREVQDELTSHLDALREAMEEPDRSRQEMYIHELYAIERWFDTPVRVPDATGEFPLTQAEYDQSFRELWAWWQGNREKLKQREGAPFQRYHLLVKAENRLSPEQQKLNAALIEAVQQRKLAQVRRLLEQGADPDARIPNRPARLRNQPVLLMAIEQGHTETVKLLLEAGASPNPLTPHDRPSLYYAAVWGDAQLVRMLLEAGATIDKAHFGKYRPLVAIAAKENKVEVMKLLLEHDYGLNERWRRRTPLHWAAADGHLEAVKFLLDRGADMHAIVEGKDWTALDLAIDEGPEVVNVLLEAGAKPDAEMLAKAAVVGDPAVVKLLLAAGIDPRESVEYGFMENRMTATPLAHAKAKIKREGYDRPGTSGSEPKRMREIVRLLEEAERQRKEE